jgi:hypothetical protein
VQPVGQKRVLGVAEHGTDIGGVFARGVEIGETADPDRQVHLDIGLLGPAAGPGFAPGVEQAAISARSRVHSACGRAMKG